MHFTVYVLFSGGSKKHYTGFTSDLTARLLSHNKLGKDWTARHRPWKLIHTKIFDSKTVALDYERWLKSGAGRDFINTLPH